MPPEKIQFIVHPNDASSPKLLAIEYCPFCGTRIDPEWLQEAKARGF